MAETTKTNNANQAPPARELPRVLTYEKFCVAFDAFLEQADKNAESGGSNGLRSPWGTEKGKLTVDGQALGRQFGQGGTSKTPYFNWYVVSIYYIQEWKQIYLGIEVKETLSRLLDRLKNLFGYEYTEEKIRDREKIAVFGRYIKAELDYKKLYEDFMKLCESVMQLEEKSQGWANAVPTEAKSPEATAVDASDFVPGMNVTHEKYGSGVVVHIDEEKNVISVSFNGQKEKYFAFPGAFQNGIIQKT